MAALALVARHGTIAVALSILLGLVVPASAAFFKPLLGPPIILRRLRLAWLYFGLAQFPICLLPMLLKKIAQRLGRG